MKQEQIMLKWWTSGLKVDRIGEYGSQKVQLGSIWEINSWYVTPP